MNRPRKVTYRAGLFESDNLSTPSKLDAALHEFAGVINQANYVEALKGLYDKNYLLELVLSGINEEIALNDWILQEFPSEPKGFEKSFAYELLVKLSKFFLFYSSSADMETASLLRDHHQYVQLASEIVSTLLTTAYLEEQGDSTFSSVNTKGKSSQRERKQAKRAARSWENIDARPFIEINVPIPKSYADAGQLCGKLCSRMGMILELFLNGIRRPDVRDLIRALFIPHERREDLMVVTDSDVPVNDDDPIPPAPTEEETPSGFPMIYSMEAGLYFDSPDDFGEWPILLSLHVSNDLRSRRKDGKVYDIIMNKIRELSRGLFSADNHKRLAGLKSDIPVFEAKVLKDLRLVYIIDCITHNDNSTELQALRFFGVYTHAQMDNRLWHLVSNYLGSRGTAYRSRCLARRAHPEGGNVYLPQSFPDSAEIGDADESVDALSTLALDDENQLHHVISLEKYVMLSKELLESIEAGREVNFPFEVSKQERAIIQHPHSCYVLGRSGTGKTITMLFKMLLIERGYQLSDKTRERPRQMFVTKSRHLAGRVEELFITYFSSLSFASHIEDHSSNFDLMRTDANRSDEENIFNEDDDPTWRNDLPERFSDLEEKHFPLFITFNHLCAMIEADINHSHFTETDDLRYNILGTSSTKRGQLVTYDHFLAEYWPHFPQHISKNFPPLLIFNEFIGVISGSEGAIRTSGHLDHDAYKNLSSRVQPTFAVCRDAVYELFLSYLKRKQELGDFDIADRTHNIIRSVVKKPAVLQKVSHLYVDETQDNLLIDTLRESFNPNGLFWAGDTAQTISAGSSFRFNDLKAFLHRVQKKAQFKTAQVLTTRSKEPIMFYLSTNYRSHAGIVNCAYTVIEMIKKYWENSIDSLPREKGNAHGAKPIFYTDISPGFIQEGRFLSRSQIKHEKIEMGAHQCILVRDEKTKERLSRELQALGGKTCLVLTLYDSKGLEFNDVILYNFFHDSVVDASQWRLALNEAYFDGKRVATPKFDQTRHAALCSELKCLYVAITRARNNLRIADESPKGEHMRALWESRKQIVSCRPGEEPTDFAKPTNEEEWANRAKLFFDNQQWLLAKECYELAGKNQSAAVADAYHRRKEARRFQTGHVARGRAFTSAARAFLSCGRKTSNVIDKNKYLKLSAECHEEGGNLLEAAKTYRKGDWFAEAATLYHELEMFDDIHELIRQAGSDSVALRVIPRSILDVTRLYFVSQNDNNRKVDQLFESFEEELEFLEGLGLNSVRLDLLLSHGMKREAAELQLSEGQFSKAIDLFLEDDTDRLTSMSRAKDTILRCLWTLLPFGVLSTKDREIYELLDHSNRIVMDDNDLDEITMFRLIVGSRHAKKLSDLGNSFLKRGNVSAAVLCLDHYFNQVPQLLDEDIAKISWDLRQFFDYVHILHDLASLAEPIKDPRVQKLFGIQAGEDGRVILPPHNPLLAFVRTEVLLDGRAFLDSKKFLKAFRACLHLRLLDRVTRENDNCRKSPALHRLPCLKHILYQNCELSPCDRLHILPTMIWFHDWIGAHLLQIVIYDSISSLQFSKEMRAQRRFWLIKLYEALNPSHHVLGSTSNMMNSVVTTFPDALPAVIDWVRALSFPLEFEPDDFLTLAMQTADFAFSFDKKAAETYMYRANFVTTPCPPQFLREPHGHNTLHEMLRSMNHKGPTCLVEGVLFIRHVMEKRIPINIHVFCTFIEHICALLIVCNRLRRVDNLHSVMLPRSWLKATVDRIDIDKAKLQDSSHFWGLLQPLEALLRSLYFPRYPGKFQFKIGPDFSPLGLKQHQPFTARICRVLGLLSLNIRVDRFHENILEVFASIRRQETDFKLPRYFYVDNIYDICKIVRRSMQGSEFDDMVQLFHSSRITKEMHEIFAVRRLVYSNHEELSSMLEPITNTTASQHHNPLVYIEATPNYESDLEKDEKFDLEPDADVPEMAVELTDNEIPKEEYLGFSDRDKRAVSVIESVYFKFLEKRRILDGVGQLSSTRRWFLLCKKALTPDMQPKFRPRYAVWYLGPLPHLLAALDVIRPHLMEEKKALRKRLIPSVHHGDLLEVNTHFTLINKAIKNTKLYQQQLEPNSALHREHDIDCLRRQVKDVFDIIREVQPLLHLPEDVRGSLSIAFKAILQESKPRTAIPLALQGKKARRPALVVEDLHDLTKDSQEDS